jgi:tetratricopeptide (TPR) repeat protein
MPSHIFRRIGRYSEPQPAQDSPFWTGVWHYARGVAFTAKGNLNEATGELNSLEKIAAEKSMEGYRVTFSRNGAKAILEIAKEVLEGELAAKRGDYDKAIAQLHRAVLLEDNLIYNEPPDWHVPVRQSLGAILLDAGRAAEAEAIYWQDLEQNRENGWSLFGLMQSLRTQGKNAQADVMEKRFNKAWKRADVTLIASRFMGDKDATMVAAGTATSGN